MDEATFEDLASLNRASRKPDRVGRRVCISSGQWIQKTRNFCPSESKAARFQASLPSPSRRGTMPALPSNGFFHPLSFAYALNRLMKGWREKSEGERDHSRILYDYYPHKMEENQ
ncbi:MAG: hypothetical protein H8E54_08690 [Candidatus Aminicenantes bacterium]|nr:hypothetical protein [Candidatus Aminicenantes bacterium]